MLRLLSVFLAVLTVASLFCAPAFAHDGARYISLAPSTTEILFALGLGKQVIGISTWCNYPPQTKGIPTMGDFSHPSIERILTAHPDYIFCTGLEQAPAIAELRRQRLNVYVADPANLQELFTSITQIGRITHTEEKAAALVAKMKEDIRVISGKVAAHPMAERPKVFLEIWSDPLTTAGKGTYIDDLVSHAGGINIAYDTPRPFCIFSHETVLDRDPDCIILAYMNTQPALELVMHRPGWETINAVKNKRVYDSIDPELLLRPGPRVAAAVTQLYGIFYPDEGKR